MASAAGLEHNKQLVRKIVEEMFNKERLEVAPEIFGPISWIEDTSLWSERA